MNLLIIGGLLVFGLLAVLGAVFLARSEKGAGETVKKPATAPASEPAGNGGSGPGAAAKDGATMQNLPVPQEETQLVAFNGQFQELAAELRTLYQETQDLEHRLSLLVKIANHIEYVQREHVSVEEEREESQ